MVEVWKTYLDTHPGVREIDVHNPRDWTFEEWKDKYKITDSSRRVKTPGENDPDPWENVPLVSFHHPPKCLTNTWQEFRNVYNTGTTLITSISEELKKMSVAGASDSENAMLMAVRELTAEIRACREVFMAVVSSFPLPPNLISLTLLIESCCS